MAPEEQAVVEEHAPTCYRHPDRETWVSCGRCGRPLCPDCIKHGPVGVRCADCLRPQRVELGVGAPEHVGMAFLVGSIEAVIWTVLLVLTGWWAETFAPNLLITGVAGAMVGWTIWRISGRTWNYTTARWTLILGISMPVLAALILTGLYLALRSVTGDYYEISIVTLLVRMLVAAAISGLLAWLLVKRRA